MKTTINIPDELMDEAQKELSIKNKTTLIVMGLQELINQNRIRKLKKYRGTLNLEIDLDVLRERKNGWVPGEYFYPDGFFQYLEEYPQLWADIIENQFLIVQKGINGVGIPDMMICCLAIHYDKILFSKDKHFKLIAEHLPLKLV